jgi:acyl-CoA thioester hydrolase/thioesterase-3
MAEWFVVRTWVEEMVKDGVRVDFQIFKKSNNKLCCDGYFVYTMVKLATGRAEPIPDFVAEKYAV